MPWRREWLPTPVFLPGESHGQRSMMGCSPRGRRVRHDWSDLARTHGNLWTWPYLETGSLRMWPEWGRPGRGWVLNSMTGTHTGKIVMRTKAEIWSRALTSHKQQRAQKTTRSSEAARKGCPLEISGTVWSCWHPELKLPVSRTLRKYVCVVSRHPVSGNLLQQPRELNSHDPPAYRIHLWRCFCRATGQMSSFQTSQIYSVWIFVDGA